MTFESNEHIHKLKLPEASFSEPAQLVSAN